MKKYLLLAFALLTVCGYSQSITVNTNSHTVPQLVNNVLINSPCVSATNITWRTGENYGSSNGLGYFTNSNPNFPMQAGVVMSTGNAMNAVGPNQTELNDGSSLWAGDSDLEATLANAGISMQSVNATVLEFDFTPISSHFNFDFVFASEEYGNFQCQFSDAFAFLLTNMNTGVTTNLAVVPNTNTPISVVTIRDFLYNSSCPSQNAQYFGSFNGGSNAASSATNFNGQTVLLNASSVLVPNTPYHIKLVIADRSDAESDSAIFISSDSFNIGQDVLGLDLTVAAGTAICQNQSYTLDTELDPSEYSFVWTKDGATITNQNGPAITITQPGTYGVTYTNIFGSCQPVTDYINIEYYAPYATPSPMTLYRCGINGTYQFDLSLNTTIITSGMTPVPVVSYHSSAANAQNDVNPLPNIYNSTGAQTIHVRIENPVTGCVTIKTFQLELSPGVVANQPSNMSKCSRSLTAVNAYFDFTTQNAAILGGQSPTAHAISYHLTQPDANTGANAISQPNHFLSVGQTIYARVQNITDPSCFSTTTFEVIVFPRPPVDQFQDIVMCENYVLPELTNGNYFTGLNGTGNPLFAGHVVSQTSTIYIYNQNPETGCWATSDFKVTIIDPLELSPVDGTYCGSYTLPNMTIGDYRTEAAGGGSIIPDGTVITETQRVYYYYVTLTEPFCAIDTHFDITILPEPQLPSLPDVFACETYILPALSVGKYYTEPSAQGTELAPGTAITQTTTIFVHAETETNPVCSADDAFTVIVGVEPPANVVQCEPYQLPMLAVGGYYTGPNATGSFIPGGTVISTPTMLYLNIPASAGNCATDLPFSVSISQPPVDTLPDVTVCDSYILPEITNGRYNTESGGAGMELLAGDVIAQTQTIYIYDSVSASCSNESSFLVTIMPPPAIDSRSDIDVCNSYTLTQLSAGNYYTGPGGTGQMLSAGTVLTQSQIVYIYAEGTGTPLCTAENSFELYIFAIEADSPANVTVCDSYVLPALTIGNYFTLPGGPATAGQTMLHAGDVISATTTLYIYAEDGDRIICSDENSFTITVNPSPVLPAASNISVCGSYTLPALTIGNYYTGPNGTGTMMNAGDVLTTDQTVYIYASNGTTPPCTDEKIFNVDIFNVDQLNDVTTCDTFVLPELNVGKYYTGPNGTGSVLPVGTAISLSRTVYIFGQSPFAPVCTDETSFVVTIVPQPVANAVPTSVATTCDEDGFNDGITVFDLTTLNSTVLGSQTSAEFQITWHASVADANSGTNPISSTDAGVAFVRVVNTLTPDCYAVRPVTIRVNTLPVPAPVDGIMCFDVETQTLISPYIISSGLSASTHTFVWRDPNGNVVGTGSTYTAVAPGEYTVQATSNLTGCASEATTVMVSPSEPADLKLEVSGAFEDQQSIIVDAIGTGIYEYQLDHGPWQDSNVFDNVSSGLHVITVRDINGCGETTMETLVINYPNYFTPNGDGYHDTWNIKDLSDDVTSKINIYDRYGKLITQISPTGNGWDGTFNGNPLPSTDYWFAVEYTHESVKREFRAHFAMKR